MGKCVAAAHPKRVPNVLQRLPTAVFLKPDGKQEYCIVQWLHCYYYYYYYYCGAFGRHVDPRAPRLSCPLLLC